MFYTFASKLKNVSEGSTNGKQHKLKVNQLLTDLRSGDEVKVGGAIKSFHVHGDAGVIDSLIEVWRGGLSPENESAMMELFEGMKDTTVIEPLMEAFRKDENQAMRRTLITAFWGSKLDFSSYLSDFVMFAVEGDFLDAFESITLIEQFETTIPEQAIMESQLLLKEYFGGNERRDAQKDTLLGDLALMLKRFEEETDMDDMYFEE